MLDWADHRRLMIAETSAFIEWGLAHPDQVRWIPRKRVGDGGFSRSMQAVFWHGVLGSADQVSRQVLARFLRWIRLG
jgi:hypothetical protein